MQLGTGDAFAASAKKASTANLMLCAGT